MIRRLLIANRGEIVCRVAQTAQRLGISAIAVYSDADREARHVRCADEAYHLGGAKSADSYLHIEKIVALAKRVGADAVHPGYGFLSENADFAAACAQAGLTFIGPPAAAIRAMGSKSAAKAAMAAAGVPVAPGYHGDEQTLARLQAEALKTGFPLIIKASAGGGGKGMQVVGSAADVAHAIESAQRLARASFGDDRVLIERYFPKARHVEVQVFADTHGNIVTLFDRDCSVQRRHQKIIEEAPAPGLRPPVRVAMAQAAIATARAVGYVSAGTVEFLVDEAQNFYFMEMNTRLQVEHPVTELITGIDLVEWQLRIAQGEPLPLSQQHIHARGAAVEARIYAENPAEAYLPSVGIIRHLHWPSGEKLRADVGYEAGDQVSSEYDPMLGKLIAWDESRAGALERLRCALGELDIAGVTTNRALLASILGDAVFRDGAVATDYLVARRDALCFGEPAPGAEDAFLAACWQAAACAAPNALWEETRGWRLGTRAVSVWGFAGESVVLESPAPDTFHAQLRGTHWQARILSREPGFLKVELHGRLVRRRVSAEGGTIHLFGDGRHATLSIVGTDAALQAGEGGEQGSLLTPLPGTVVAVHVEQGAAVERGAPLITVEAMKMEHTVTAPYAGTIARVVFRTGERVPAGAVLVELTPAG